MPPALLQDMQDNDQFKNISTKIIITAFIVSLSGFIIYTIVLVYVLYKTKKEAIRHYSAAIVLTAFFISFFSRATTDMLRIIIR